jgi:hypothetical protein
LYARVLICDVLGRRSVAPPRYIMERIKTYAMRAHKIGLSPAEMSEDIEKLYPSKIRRIDVEVHSDGVLCIVVKPRNVFK